MKEKHKIHAPKTQHSPKGPAMHEGGKGEDYAKGPPIHHAMRSTGRRKKPKFLVPRPDKNGYY